VYILDNYRMRLQVLKELKNKIWKTIPIMINLKYFLFLIETDKRTVNV